MTEYGFRLEDAPDMPRAGDVLVDRYRLNEVIGEGGFAAVFRATDLRVEQEVAVKVLDPLMSRRPRYVARFNREIRTITSLRHPNTITVTDRGTTDRGCLFLVMELLQGKPLDRLLKEEGSLAPERVAHIALQVLKSLAEAHDKGIIHRDIKPANVFLVRMAGEKDFVKVLDFGIAKSMEEDDSSGALTCTGEVLCSPHYVAPERLRENVTFPASDLYSLGIMMLELLDGRPPYDGDNAMSITICHAMVHEPVPIAPEHLNGPLANVLRRSTAKLVEARYQSADAMLADLQPVVHGLLSGGLTRDAAAIPDTAPMAGTQRRRALLITAGLGAVATVGLAAVLVAAVQGGGPIETQAAAGGSERLATAPESPADHAPAPSGPDPVPAAADEGLWEPAPTMPAGPEAPEPEPPGEPTPSAVPEAEATPRAEAVAPVEDAPRPVARPRPAGPPRERPERPVAPAPVEVAPRPAAAESPAEEGSRQPRVRPTNLRPY
jgi:serine/threonine-protein kinase